MGIEHRLFITLQHRNERPGFHWSLVLAPKSEGTDPKVKDSHLFHATNSLTLNATTTGKLQWRYEWRKVSTAKCTNIVARFLVAKLSGSQRLVDHAESINKCLVHVPLEPYDPSWTCRIWVQHALVKLRAMEGDFISIPPVPEGSELERCIIAFGEEKKMDIINGSLVITLPKDVPQEDIRAGGSRG
ncbi:hypothetical protein AX17_005632 [Amanita inopinata Kibby_2008]|nr:hypothetical protein AX17_005632 [Amanita inopinata Kibby_2008]